MKYYMLEGGLWRYNKGWFYYNEYVNEWVQVYYNVRPEREIDQIEAFIWMVENT